MVTNAMPCTSRDLRPPDRASFNGFATAKNFFLKRRWKDAGGYERIVFDFDTLMPA
jgi:hypothetical protein